MDSESTVDIFRDARLLTHIHTVNQIMRVYYNAGVASTNKMETLEGYGLVWLYANAIANIISIYRISTRFHE